MTIEASEAAKKLGVHPSTITNLCLKGLVKSEKRLNSRYRYSWFVDRQDLEEYEARRWQRRRTDCKPLSETEKAYIAGLFDGEGCFTAFITRQKSHHIKNGQRTDEAIHWQTIYYIQILVVEEAPIHWLKQVTGLGYVFKRTRQDQGHQDLWGWKTSGPPACAIIEQILPYLKIKSRHAEIFLELRDRIATTKSYRRGTANDTAMPREEYLIRQKLIDEIHELNKPTGKILRKYE